MLTHTVLTNTMSTYVITYNVNTYVITYNVNTYNVNTYNVNTYNVNKVTLRINVNVETKSYEALVSHIHSPQTQRYYIHIALVKVVTVCESFLQFNFHSTFHIAHSHTS
jgi:hypothetical protein